MDKRKTAADVFDELRRSVLANSNQTRRNGTRAIRGRVNLTVVDVQFDTRADTRAEYDR
jgi:hypothetical protein